MKKSKITKSILMFLTILMILSCMPLSVFAEENTDSDYPIAPFANYQVNERGDISEKAHGSKTDAGFDWLSIPGGHARDNVETYTLVDSNGRSHNAYCIDGDKGHGIGRGTVYYQGTISGTAAIALWLIDNGTSALSFSGRIPGITYPTGPRGETTTSDPINYNISIQPNDLEIALRWFAWVYNQDDQGQGYSISKSNGMAPKITNGTPNASWYDFRSLLTVSGNVTWPELYVVKTTTTYSYNVKRGSYDTSGLADTVTSSYLSETTVPTIRNKDQTLEFMEGDAVIEMVTRTNRTCTQVTVNNYESVLSGDDLKLAREAYVSMVDSVVTTTYNQILNLINSHRSENIVGYVWCDNNYTYQRFVTFDYIEQAFYKINVKKVDKDTGVALSGAKFKLTKPDGSTEISDLTGSDGIASWDKLPKGTYSIEEYSAPSNYDRFTGKITVELPSTSSSNENKTDYSISYDSEGNPTITVKDQKSVGTVKVKKVDIFDKAISGVTFSLYKSTTKTSSNLVATAKTNADGIATFDNVVVGTYYVFETDVPKKSNGDYYYDFDPNKYYKVVVTSGKTVWANDGDGIINEPLNFTITVYKTREGGKDLDFTMSDNLLEGAYFQLSFSENQNGPFTNIGTPQKTNNGGTTTWNKLTKEGYYRVVETQAPTGYKLDPTPHTFYLSKDNNSKSDRYGNISIYAENEPEKEWTPVVYKELFVNTEYNTERKLKENEFWFQLVEYTNADRTTGKTILQTKGNSSDGTVTFDKLIYHKEDAGTHYYRVYELTNQYGTAVNDTHSGSDETVWYSNHYVDFTVTLTYTPPTKNGLGSSLSINASNPSKTDRTFPNYVPYGKFKPTAEKVLIGRTLKYAEFNFDLYEVMSDGSLKQIGGSVGNNEDGVIAFPEIIYQLQDCGTHVYRIYEYKGSDKTVQYDTTYVEWTVVVEYFGESTSSATRDADGYNVKLKVTATQSHTDKSFALKTSQGVVIDNNFRVLVV